MDIPKDTLICYGWIHPGRLGGFQDSHGIPPMDHVAGKGPIGFQADEPMPADLVWKRGTARAAKKDGWIRKSRNEGEGGDMGINSPKTKRPRYEMPEFVKQALEKRNLMDDYEKRPAYQRNDYIGWIERAKRWDTKEKRLRQMLDELETGGVYMKMKHPPSRKQ